jgi:hypothetical protein
MCAMACSEYFVLQYYGEFQGTCSRGKMSSCWSIIMED